MSFSSNNQRKSIYFRMSELQSYLGEMAQAVLQNKNDDFQSASQSLVEEVKEMQGLMKEKSSV